MICSCNKFASVVYFKGYHLHFCKSEIVLLFKVAPPFLWIEQKWDLHMPSSHFYKILCTLVASCPVYSFFFMYVIYTIQILFKIIRRDHCSHKPIYYLYTVMRVDFFGRTVRWDKTLWSKTNKFSLFSACLSRVFVSRPTAQLDWKWTLTKWPYFSRCLLKRVDAYPNVMAHTRYIFLGYHLSAMTQMIWLCSEDALFGVNLQ